MRVPWWHIPGPSLLCSGTNCSRCSRAAVGRPGRRERCWRTVLMLDKLLELAHDRGFITYDEILAHFPEPERAVEDLDQLYAALGAEGIAVIETPADATSPSSLTPHADEESSTMADLGDVALD